MSYYEVKMTDGASLNVSIFNPAYKEMSLLNASVVMGAGEAGNFDFMFPRNHVYIDSLIPFGSTIEVLEDGQSIFYGRPLAPSTDFWGQKKVHCEGALAFLNDVVCPKGAAGLSSSMNDGQYYRFLINYYNSQQARADRKLYLGSVPSGGVSRVHEWSFRSCMDELRSEILPYTGGIILTRRTNGKTYLDWVNAFTTTGNQPITIGTNLLDVTRTGHQIYTMAIASGGKDANGNEIAMSDPVRLSAALCGKYGNICAYLSFPAVTSVSQLQAQCLLFLTKQQFNSFSFEANAIDLHISNEAYDRLTIGKNAVIKFSDLDSAVTMPITKINVDLNTGKKTIFVSSSDWTEKKQYVKNDISAMSLTELQVDAIDSIADIDMKTADVDGVDLIDAVPAAYYIDPVTGQKIQFTVSMDSETGAATISLAVVPVGVIARRIEGQYVVGDTITGDLVRRTEQGEETDLDSYTYLATDTVTVVHENGVVEQYGTGEPFIFYYGDTLSIVTAEGDTITFKTYEEEPMYEAGDVFDSSEYDVFLEYGDGSEVKLDDEDWSISIEDGYEFKGTNEDPMTATVEVDKTPNDTKITEIDVDDEGDISSEISVGEIELETPLTDTIPLGVDGMGAYVTGIEFLQTHGDYISGQKFDKSDYSIVSVYSDGSVIDVTSECSLSIPDNYEFTGSGDPSELTAVWTSDSGDTFTTSTQIIVFNATGEFTKLSIITEGSVEGLTRAYDSTNYKGTFYFKVTFESVNGFNIDYVTSNKIIENRGVGVYGTGIYIVDYDGIGWQGDNKLTIEYEYLIEKQGAYGHGGYNADSGGKKTKTLNNLYRSGLYEKLSDNNESCYRAVNLLSKTTEPDEISSQDISYEGANCGMLGFGGTVVDEFVSSGDHPKYTIAANISVVEAIRKNN